MKEVIIKYCLLTYVVLVVLTTLLLPPINIVSLDNFLFPIAIIGLMMHYYKLRFFRISLLFIFILIGTAVMSNVINGLINFSAMSFSVRWLKIFTVAWSVYFTISTNKVFFEKLILLSFLGMVIINALQLMGINVIIDLYAPKTEYIDILQTTLIDARLFGTFLNPNNNGLVFALFGIYFFASEIPRKYVLTSISGLLLLMTQSRTAFIAFVIALIVTAAIRLYKKKIKQFLWMLAGTAFSLLLLAQLKFNNLSSLFDLSAFQSNSVKIRQEVIRNTIEVNNNTKWFGKGHVHDIPQLVGGSIDNEYAYVYLQYGIIGLLLILIWVSLLFILSIRNRAVLGGLGLLIIMLICGLTNLSFSSLETSTIFIVLFASILVFHRHKGLNKEGQ